MKLALILPGSIWFAPYLRIYTRILENKRIDYSIISWNRESDDRPEGFQYNVKCRNRHGAASYASYMGYAHYIRRTVKEQGFDRLILFGPQLTCLLSVYLLTRFRRKYMIDYRDLSIEQKPGLKQLFSVMLRFSCLNVISSPGFKSCLPKRDDYVLSHNFDLSAVMSALEKKKYNQFYHPETIEVLTIGAIRDYSSNIEVVKALGNKTGFKIIFVGKGRDSIRIQDYCNKNKINNISFIGFYEKQDEEEYITNCTFMNIFYPRIITHDTALSNRFYNSLIYKKPMIVTKNTTQGDFAEHYQVGVAVENCSDLDGKLKSFLKMDFTSYAEKCDSLLTLFLKDQSIFEKAVLKFVKV